uniref:Uncharacterized protein n=1 Tax=Arundo donax TaxID=35708 RepID=A0A0A9AUM6_ARUDO
MACAQTTARSAAILNLGQLRRATTWWSSTGERRAWVDQLSGHRDVPYHRTLSPSNSLEIPDWSPVAPAEMENGAEGAGHGGGGEDRVQEGEHEDSHE